MNREEQTNLAIGSIQSKSPGYARCTTRTLGVGRLSRRSATAKLTVCYFSFRVLRLNALLKFLQFSQLTALMFWVG